MKSSKAAEKPSSAFWHAPVGGTVAVAAVLLGVLLCGCATDASSPALYRQRIEEISSEVDDLPNSPEKRRIKRLIADLRQDLTTEAMAAKLSAAVEEVEVLRKLAAATEVTAAELGFATAKKDWTGDGATDGLELYFTPRDADGSAVKAPGTLSVTLSNEGMFGGRGKELDSWEISARALSGSWNGRLFPGYVLRLPWSQGEPESDGPIVSATFKPLYGKSILATTRLGSLPR